MPTGSGLASLPPNPGSMFSCGWCVFLFGDFACVGVGRGLYGSDEVRKHTRRFRKAKVVQDSERNTAPVPPSNR
jgi:hypothetical protein